ncbi:conserved domain protein [Nocardioidaceae bacterium Broad-1]|nr:conserved domain protein [Nocardioidaceae bacterium Broad-1]
MTKISNRPGPPIGGRSQLSPEILWSVEEVSDFLQVPVNTLYQWRHKGTGPSAFRVGRFLRYDPAVVRDWLSSMAGGADGIH